MKRSDLLIVALPSSLLFGAIIDSGWAAIPFFIVSILVLVILMGARGGFAEKLALFQALVAPHHASRGSIRAIAVTASCLFLLAIIWRTISAY